MVRILGVDPGSRITGFAVIEVRGQRVGYVDSGCIRTPEGPFPERLRAIFEGLGQIIARHQPDEMAVEQVFMHRNAASALKLGHARGAALCAGVMAGVPISEYAASAIKQAVVGTGAADKTQVQHMVQALLGLPASPQADAADALAVALCHGHTRQTQARLGAAAAGGLPGRRR